jgi:lysophospholipase L1-like esterase
MGHEHTPNTEAFLMGVDIKINSQGLRDREIPLERTPGTGRIIMLGDSLVLGWGVQFDDILSKRLERKFAADGHPVEVINAGVGNYNSIQEVEYYLTRGYKFHPDLVVLNFDCNDAEPVPSYADNNFFERNSELVVVAKAALDKFMRKSGAILTWDQYYLSLFGNGDTPGWAAAKAAIHKLAVATRAQGAQLVIVHWPELHDVKNYRLQKIIDLAREEADAEGVPFIDLLQAVKGMDSSKLWLTEPDPHPNTYTQGLYTDYLYPKFKALLAAH